MAPRKLVITRGQYELFVEVRGEAWTKEYYEIASEPEHLVSDALKKDRPPEFTAAVNIKAPIPVTTDG